MKHIKFLFFLSLLFLSPCLAQASSGSTDIPWAWYIIRATGLTAYILMFIVIVSGFGFYTKLIFKIFKSETAFIAHILFSFWTAVFIVIHISALFFDEFLGFSLTKAFVPFLSPFKPVPVALGIFAFYLFFLIVFSSVFLRAKKRRLWRLLHYFSYPTFFFVHVHAVTAGTDAVLLREMYWVTGGVFAFIVAYRVAYHFFVKEYEVIIARIEKPAHDIIILDLALPQGEKLKFKPGQYVSLALFDEKHKPGAKHHFSIASSPDDEYIRLGIKVYGNFTQKLAKMKEGDKLALYGPYGDFIFEPEKMQDTVFIAGGIGVTPFMSALRFAEKNKLSNKLSLLYSNRTVEETAFLAEIRNLAKKNSNFKPYFTITDEAAPQGFEHGMFCQATIQKFVEKFSDKYFFICGPAPFMDAMVDCLRASGVPQSKIRREFFY